MKQIFITFIVITITLTSFSQTQLEMNQQSSVEQFSADDELNYVYNQILIDYQNDSNFIEKLKISQRLWIKFRDAELEMKFPETDKRNYGSMYPMCANGYLEQLTKERIKKLKEWLKPPPDGEGCVGSIKYRAEIENEITIEKIENYEFQRLLNGLEILKEFQTPELSIRIISLGNLSGSAGFANGEITHNLFFTVSEIDEYPKQNVFRVSEFYNVNIESIDSTNEMKQIIEISFDKFGERERMKFELTIDELIKTSR